MKKTSLVIATLALATGFAHAEGELSAGIDATSAYIFRGATVNNDINLNPALGGTFGDFAVGVWGNFNTDSTQFDEVDFTLDYTVPMGDDAPFGVSIGYTEYLYPTAVDTGTVTAEDGTETQIISGGTEADREVNVKLSCDCPASPSLGIYYGIEGPFLKEGLYLELGAGHSVALTEDNNLDLGVAVGYEAGDNVESTGFSHATFSAGTAVGDASLALNYVLELDDNVLEVDEEFFISIGLAL
jgi:hypothetical protein